MSAAAGGVFLTRAAFGGGLSFRHASKSARLNVRSLALTSQMSARSKMPTDDKEVDNEPIKFSTSKASHRTWKVNQSLGSQHERSWWKVIPVTLLATGYLLWCALRDETDIDTQLDKHLYEQLPGLHPDKEEEQVKNKPT